MRIRLVCLGASETFGLHEPDGLGFPRHLEIALNRSNGPERYEVVNAAIPGQSLPAMARRLPETLALVQPELAVIYPSPALYIRPSHLNTVAALPEPGLDALRMTERFAELGKRALPERLQTWARERAIERDPELRLGALERVPESSLELFRADLRGLIAGLRQAGVEPVLATHATAFTTGQSARERALLVAWRRFYPRLEPDGFLDLERRANEAVRAVGDELGVRVVDVDASMPRDPRYFADFAHFTAEGAAVMGRLLADGLQPVLARRGQ